MQLTPTVPLALTLGLLCGCAAGTRSSAVETRTEPDCSFRSPTSCWTMAARLPSRRAEASDSQPGELLRPSPAVLASSADSAAGSR
jgi:hypothetical protein